MLLPNKISKQMNGIHLTCAFEGPVLSPVLSLLHFALINGGLSFVSFGRSPSSGRRKTSNPLSALSDFPLPDDVVKRHSGDGRKS